MLSKKKVSPSITAQFSASILDTICSLDPNKITNLIHHRIRELQSKLKKVNRYKFKPASTKKYLEGAIKRSLEIREISKELQDLASKLSKLHDKVIQPDIKNAVNLAKASSKSALESIKINKEHLRRNT